MPSPENRTHPLPRSRAWIVLARSLAMPLALSALASLCTACAGQALSRMDRGRLLQAVESGELFELLDTPGVPYSRLAELEPGTLLYLGLHALERGQAQTGLRLFQEALRHEPAPWREEATYQLGKLIIEEKNPQRRLALLDSNPALLDTNRELRTRFDAMLEAGDPAGAEMLLRSLSESSLSADHDSYVQRLCAAWLDKAAGAPGEQDRQAAWTSALALLPALDSQRSSVALGEVYFRLVDETGDLLTERQRQLLRIRGLCGIRDYGATVRTIIELVRSEAQAKGTIEPGERVTVGLLADWVAGAPRQYAADAGKSWLYSEASQGAALFTALAEQATADDQAAYLYAFYAGRCLLRTGELARGLSMLASAAGLAKTPADRTAANWYVVEALAEKQPLEAIARLRTALAETRDPLAYDDLIGPLLRRMLLERNGAALAGLGSLARFCSPEMSARLAYVAARCLQTGIIGQTAASTSGLAEALGLSEAADKRILVQSLFLLARDQSASQWYRLLAAYRLEDPLPPPRHTDFQPSTDVYTDYQSYLQGLVDWRLEARLYSDSLRLADRLAPAELRAVAERLEAREEYASAIRLTLRLLARSGYAATEEDRRLAWPRPYGEAMRLAVTAAEIDTHLMYALVRSESLFQPTVVSRAGAVGLAQLMPATAEEMGWRLKLDSYDSRNPSDNLYMGAAYLRRLLNANNGAVLPALFSYNAGPGRYNQWRRRAGDLPHDLLLETLDYAETRQYGATVVLSALQYASLYDSIPLRPYLAGLLGE